MVRIKKTEYGFHLCGILPVSQLGDCARELGYGTEPIVLGNLGRNQRAVTSHTNLGLLKVSVGQDSQCMEPREKKGSRMEASKENSNNLIISYLFCVTASLNVFLCVYFSMHHSNQTFSLFLDSHFHYDLQTSVQKIHTD